MTLEPWQERLVAEKAQIDERVQLCARFVGSDDFVKKVDPQERQRLVDQLFHMRKYALILGDRIAAFQRG